MSPLLRLAAFWVVAMCSFAGSACAQVLINEVVSREVAIHVGGIQTPEIKEIVSREVSFFIENGTAGREVISREVGVGVGNEAVPPQVTGYIVTPSAAGDQVVLDWTSYNPWAVRDVKRFDIYVAAAPFTDVSGLSPVLTVGGETVTATLTGLPILRDHYIAIVAVDLLDNRNTTVVPSGAYIISPQAISREVSLFTGGEPSPPYREVISRESSIVVVTPEPPPQIVDFEAAASPTGRSVSLNWSSYNPWAIRDVRRFDIYVASQPFASVAGLSAVRSVGAETLSTVIDGLPEGQDHFIAIVPVDGLENANPAVIYSGAYVLSPQAISREASLFIGGEPPSPYREVVTREASFVVADGTVPAPVTGLTSGFTAVTSPAVYRAIDLDWTSYNEWLQRDVRRYRVYVDTQFFDNVSGMVPFAFVSDGTQRHSLTGLFPSQIYFVAVVAEDTSGNFNPVVRAVSAQASNISAWRRSYFTAAELANPALQASLWGDYADPDRDGVLNLVEYAFGGNLRSASLLNSAGLAPLLPSQRVTQIGSSAFYDIVFRRKVDASEVFIDYTPELSQDLVSWLPANTPGQSWTAGTIIPAGSEPGMAGFERVALRLATDYTFLPERLFGRVRVTLGESSATLYGTLLREAAPVHRWSLDDLPGATTVRDAAGGPDATFQGGVTLAQAPHGRRGYAARFDGAAGSFIDLGQPSIGQTVTVEAWVRLDSDAATGRRHAIVSRWPASFSLEIGVDDRPRFLARNTTNQQGVASSLVPLTRGMWHHIVGVFEAGAVRIWVNGVAGVPQTIGGVLTASPAPRAIVGAVEDGSAGASAFKGLIDEVAIYDRPLTPAEITSHWQALADLNGDGVLDL